MPTLLGRDLTADEQAVEVALRATVAERRKSRDADTSFFETAANVPELLCPAAVTVLESDDMEPSLRRWLYTQLLERPECVQQIVTPGHFTREQLLAVCRHLMTIDNYFDVRLAGLLPRAYSDHSHLDSQTLIRVLDVLDEISPGSRLILSLNHLTHHPDQHVSSKATLLVGRRLQNRAWVARQMASADARVRASVIEGLWDIRTESSREILKAALGDEHNRVVGNALVGLHRLGDPGVVAQARQMIEDPRPPFRWTAAWVMGKIGDPEFETSLQRALRDKEPKVGKAAERALAALLTTRQAPAPPTAAAEPPGAPAAPAGPQASAAPEAVPAPQET